MSYEGTAELTGASNVSAGSFEYFDNIPDERYPTTELLTTPTEERTLLFATDTSGVQALAYVLERPDSWSGRVVAYQPGEYQPQALDDIQGNNFQILVNAILYSAGTLDASPGDGDGDAGIPGDGDSSNGLGDDPGEESEPGTTSNDSGGCHLSPDSPRRPLGKGIAALGLAWLVSWRRRTRLFK